MTWKLAKSDNHKWERERPFASLTTVRLNFNSGATELLEGHRYLDLFTDSDRKMFKVVPNHEGRKLSPDSHHKHRVSMTYAHLGSELPPGRYFYIEGTEYEFKLEDSGNIYENPELLKKGTP